MIHWWYVKNWIDQQGGWAAYQYDHSLIVVSECGDVVVLAFDTRGEAMLSNIWAALDHEDPHAAAALVQDLSDECVDYEVERAR